jgi:fibronectin-binding autotransporter adhesin
LGLSGAGNTLTIGGYALANGSVSLSDTIGGTGNVTITGSVTDGGTSGHSSLAYNGSGTLTISGSSSYHGATTLSSGTMEIFAGRMGAQLANIRRARHHLVN